jgi:hypothetical protein
MSGALSTLKNQHLGFPKITSPSSRQIGIESSEIRPATSIQYRASFPFPIYSYAFLPGAIRTLPYAPLSLLQAPCTTLLHNYHFPRLDIITCLEPVQVNSTGKVTCIPIVRV